MNLMESVRNNLKEADSLRELAKDFYKYTTDISITEDELLDGEVAKHPELKNAEYEEIVDTVIDEIYNDLKNNTGAIQRQMRTDCDSYGTDSPEYKEIKEMYGKLKKAGININLKDKEINESEESAEDIINPEDKDYADGHLMRVCLWSGAGYSLSEFYVYVRGDDAQAALEKVVAYCEEKGYDGLIMPINEIEDMAEKDYAEEVANYDGDLDEFITNYLNYVYVDATMDGASQPYYVYGENLRIENVEEPINEAEEDEVEEDNSGDMDELKERLQKIANEGNALVEDVAEDQLDEVDNYDTPQDFIEHLTELYITGGGVSSMIYYDDTLKFLESHEEEINELLKDGIREFGSLHDMFGDNYDEDDPMNLGTSNRNLFAWYAYEETARNIAYQLNEEYNYNANI